MKRGGAVGGSTGTGSATQLRVGAPTGGRTGARWSLAGAEAILPLRALRTSGDFDDYWQFHLAKEHERVQQSRYADGAVPNPLPRPRPQLRLVTLS